MRSSLDFVGRVSGIVLPSQGGLLQSGEVAQVRAAVPMAGTEEVHSLIDGQVAGTRTPGLGLAAGTMEWAWHAGDSGSHTLAVQASANGQVMLLPG